MKVYHRALYGLSYVLASIACLYSYSLVDPNITFINHPLWTQFRNIMVQFGYYQRELSSIVFLILILAFSGFHFLCIKYSRRLNLWHLIIPLCTLTVFSYPLLSHDFFNYMFDAKVLTFYQQNPYLHKPMDFPSDPWLRFMHWTHRTYPYGPIFLGITAIPSFLSFGKFLLAFIFMKTMFVSFYLAAVYCLYKLNKRWAIFFATNPLIIFEGLINAHNDFIALSLAIIGIYFLFKNKNIFARILLLFSGGIKYITLPLLLISKSKKSYIYFSALGLLLILIYLALKHEVQPWYFLALFAFIPFNDKLISSFNIFFIGLLLSYYPYVRYDGWTDSSSIEIKHVIIMMFLLINIGFILKKRYTISK